MAKYFMGDTRLGWLEKMMMDPSRTSSTRSDPRRNKPQKKPPCNRTVKPQTHGRSSKGDSL